MSLLLAGLADSLRLQSDSGPVIELALSDDSRATKAFVRMAPDGRVCFALARNQAEYLHVVLLRAFRDQVAEVDHVHLEGERQSVPFDLTLMFEVFRSPMSAEDAARLMDD